MKNPPCKGKPRPARTALPQFKNPFFFSSAPRRMYIPLFPTSKGCGAGGFWKGTGADFQLCEFQFHCVSLESHQKVQILVCYEITTLYNLNAALCTKRDSPRLFPGQTCLKYKQAEWSTASLYTISQLPCNRTASVSDNVPVMRNGVTTDLSKNPYPWSNQSE